MATHSQIYVEPNPTVFETIFFAVQTSPCGLDSQCLGEMQNRRSKRRGTL